MDKTKKIVEFEEGSFQGVVIRVGEISAEIVDQDILQLKDELNNKWVHAWSKEVKRNRKDK